MKAEELMVDDWVYGCTDPYSPNEEQKKFPVRVSRIELDGDIYTIGKNPSDDPYDYEWWNIEPIPLTPEILEKNGFERGSDNLFSYGRGMYVMMWSKGHYSVGQIFGNWSAFVEFAEIRFIHELQHALKLCGIDKEIVV